jgi:hypothetical protein
MLRKVMISNKQIASEVSGRILEVNRLLNEVVALAQGGCSPEELSALKLAVGRVLGELLVEMANPLYQAHPGLKPNGLDVPNT